MKCSKWVVVFLGILFGFSGSGECQQLRFYRVPDEQLEARLGAAKVKNVERQAELQRLFEEAGCKGESLELQRVSGTKAPNIFCTLRGETQVTVVVGAHHDKVPQSALGLVDNWSGASMLPSLYESLAKEKRQITFIFAGFAAEEDGFLGSEEMMKQWKKQGRGKIEAMVNIDSVGMTPTKVWPARSDERLLAVLAGVARAMKLPVSGVDVSQVGDSDSVTFAQRKIPVVDVHGVTQETFRTLHSPYDKPGAVVFEHYRDTYRLMAGFLSFLDSMQAAARTGQ